MELMQMEMFVAVVEERSVRGAAERVFRTQPAVSIAIRKLEEEIGAALFDRSKRYEYRLTQVGEAMYNYATRMLHLRNEAASALGDICNLRAGRLRIGANESVSLHLLPRLAEAFLKQHPRIRMEVKCERSESLLADLKDRNLDLALISFRPEDKKLDGKFIMQDELVLITHPSHPLAAKENVSVGDLSEESLLVMDVSKPSPWHKKISDAFVKSKAPLHLTVENAPIETIKKMVAIGLGVGFVPLMCVRQERQRGELAVMEVEGLHQERSVWLVRRRAIQSSAAKAFAAIAETFGTHGPLGHRFLPLKQETHTARRSKVLVVKQRA
jgi:DNA-binding transcriptional LysR family regulator